MWAHVFTLVLGSIVIIIKKVPIEEQPWESNHRKNSENAQLFGDLKDLIIYPQKFLHSSQELNTQKLIESDTVFTFPISKPRIR